MSQLILLDTHIWLWLVNGNFDKFPTQWRNQIEEAPRVGISPVSCYEIALAHSRRRIRLPSTAKEWFTEALLPVGIELIPITEIIASQAVSLSPVHKDPFDRLILATAIIHGAKLASVDGLISRYAEADNVLLK